MKVEKSLIRDGTAMQYYAVSYDGYRNHAVTLQLKDNTPGPSIMCPAIGMLTGPRVWDQCNLRLYARLYLEVADDMDDFTRELSGMADV